MKRQAGFTLIELSLVLLALGLILPGAIIFWQLSERHRVATVQVDMQTQSRDALIGFLHANYRLPCPAIDVWGVEDCSAVNAVGFFPWKTVALPRPETGTLLYGVHRAPSAAGLAQAPLDQDLAVVRDRMNPLRVRMPASVPRNADGPNPYAPPVPSVIEGVLGMTQSGLAAPRLNSLCDPASEPACPIGTDKAVNLLDICLALHRASETLEAGAGHLGVRFEGGVNRSAAFVIVAPGMLDADGDGKPFDGSNAQASNTAPVFEAPSRAVAHDYDDVVIAASHAELFAQLHCGAALSAISHAHFNVSTGAFVLERAMYDYRDQLYIAKVLARADVAAAAAGVAAAISGALDAAKEMVSAVADTTVSVGVRSFQIGLAGVGIGLAAASGGAATYAVIDAALSLQEAEQVHNDFARRTTAMTVLSRSIASNALTADAIGH